jgi:hypothetical protein
LIKVVFRRSIHTKLTARYWLLSTSQITGRHAKKNFKKILDEHTMNGYISFMSMLHLLHLRTPRTMPERFAWIMDALFWAMTEKHALVPDRLLHLATRRIRRFVNLVSRVLAALEAGTYRAPRPRAPRNPQAAQPAAQPATGDAPGDVTVPAEAPPAAVPPKPPQRLPRRRGWLAHALAGTYGGSQFEHLLRGPEMIAAIQAAPALARPLRGLCHMLGIPVPELIRLPERPCKPRPPRPPTPKREKPKKFKIYKYWMRTGPIFGERLRRFGPKKSPR